LTSAETEIINQRIAGKEKRLREESEALKRKQEKLEIIKANTEIASVFTENLSARMEQTVATLASLPKQMKLFSFGKELQRIPSRGLLNRVINTLLFELHIPGY